MKTIFSIIAAVLYFCPNSLLAETNTEVFVSGVNSNWVQRSYSDILTEINIRLTEDPDDLLALGLKVGYYFWADVDLTELEIAASNFVVAVNIQDPQELAKPGYLLEQAEVFSDIKSEAGTNVASRTQNQVDHVHQVHPKTFPLMPLYIKYKERVTGE